MNKKILFTFLISVVFLTSCHNGDWSYPDYDFKGVYFAYQFPVRTITLGENKEISTTLDNAHKFKIMGTVAGVYNNDKDVTINIQVDNSLTNDLVYKGRGDDIEPMPEDYYDLASDRIVIPKGQLTGGVEIHLTNQFFNDPKSLNTTYVIPVKMTDVVNADSILSGSQPQVDNPNEALSGDWKAIPKDFTFYAVKYINKWDGFYLRRGKDVITKGNGQDSTSVRHSQYVSDDPVIELDTKSLHKITYPVIYQNSQGQNVNSTLILTFDDQNNCTVSSANPGSYSASGSGEFVKDGAKNSFGQEDRDAIYLDYQVDLSNMHVETTDTLVLRNRGVSFETFTVDKK